MPVTRKILRSVEDILRGFEKILTKVLKFLDPLRTFSQRKKT